MKTVSTLFISSMLVLLVSCNLFVSSPQLPSNIEDSTTQLTVFTAFPSSDKSVTTIWNWRDVQSGDPSFSVDEIEIVHSTFGFLDFYVPFVGKQFNDNSVWKYDWTSLDPSKTHYFSLFIKNGDGDWLPSYKMKVTLPGKTISTNLSVLNIWRVSSTPAMTSGVTSDSVNGSSVFVLELTLPPNIKIHSAVINPSSASGIKTVSLLSFRIFPLIQPFNELDSSAAWEEVGHPTASTVGSLVDTDSGVTYSGTNNVFNTTAMDVTIPVTRALLTGSNQLVLYSEDKSNIIVTVDYTDFLVIQYEAE